MNVDVEIRGMHCASCVGRVEEAARSLPGVREARVNLASERASLDLDPERFAAPAFAAALRERGYRAAARRLAWRVTGLDPSGLAALEARLRALPGVVAASASYAQGSVAADVLFDPGIEAFLRERGLDPRAEDVASEADPEARSLLLRTIVAVPLAALVMTLTMTHAAPPWLLALLAAPVHLWAGWPFHAGFLRSIRHLAPDMNALVSLGTNAAFLASPFLDHPWYETSAVIIAVVLLGRLLESRARRGTRRAVEALLELAPREDVRPGDERTLKPGERFPADGVVLDGAGAVDESMISGESAPVEKKAGDRVVGGTLNRSGALRVRFDRTGDDTMLARIVRLVRQTQGSKPAVQRTADRWAAVFVPLVVVLAAITAAAWLILDPSRALANAVSVLVVACPCALGLATPAAVMVGAGRAARLGILFKDADALEVGARLRTVVFDKTGTLTEGRPAVVDVVPSSLRGEILRAAGAVERLSEHPVAKAIADAAGPGPEARNFEAFPGSGAIAEVEGVPTIVGNRAFLESQGLDASSLDAPGSVYVAQPGRVLGRIAVADALRPDAAAAVRDLQAMGLDVALLSGDVAAVAGSVARAVGIPEGAVAAGVRPEGKSDAVGRLQERGPVAMVGDGINDAPALAKADLGIAVAKGTDVAVESADVVLLANDLARVPAALRIARATLRVIRQNFAWAFGYNALLIPLAAGLFAPFGLHLDPRVAAAAMAMSSITVVANALRLNRAG